MTNHITAKLYSTPRAKLALAVFLALALFALCPGLSASDHNQQSTIISFSAPGAGTGSGQGTFALGINSHGVIVGYYLDENYGYHGFLRSSDGSFTTFDAPGSYSGGGTLAIGLNQQGAVVGYYADANDRFHAFLRRPDGTFTTDVAPGECRGSDFNGCNGTGAYDINDSGMIAGAYLDVNFVRNGFVLSRNGTFTSFEAPGAGNGAYQGSAPDSVAGLNQSGALSGYDLDDNNVYHSFLRDSEGNFTLLDVQGAGTSAGQGTIAEGINDPGAIVGQYVDASGVNHGFLWADGNYTMFDVQGAGTGSGQGTIPDCINTPGTIVGQYIDASSVNHGFWRTRSGNITTLDAPAAGTSAGQGTIPTDNNAAGAITGYYVDANNVNYGFVGTSLH
jgi:probable HAF family extracellular repeat protein